MTRLFIFFFFQAEDGIRDYKVTGVQTCALPIYVVEDDVREEVRDGIDLPDDRPLVQEEHLEHVRERPRGPTACVELDADVLAEAVEEGHEGPGKLRREEGPLDAVSWRFGRVLAHHRRGVAARVEAERHQADAMAELGILRHAMPHRVEDLVSEGTPPGVGARGVDEAEQGDLPGGEA